MHERKREGTMLWFTSYRKLKRDGYEASTEELETQTVTKRELM
jgi:hypothetical protein